MSVRLFVWHATNYTDSSTDYLFENHFLAGFTPQNIALGTASAVIELAAILQGEVIRDLILLAVVVVYSGWRHFDKQIESQLLVHANQIPKNQLEQRLKQYTTMRRVNHTINFTIGTVFKFVVMQNLFQYAYLFSLLLTQERFDMRVVYATVDTMKASWTFFVALQIHYKVLYKFM